MVITNTATAQSALQDLSWDETIVPTLRKRLQSESRAISKRMSTISIGSGDDSTPPYSQKAQSQASGPNSKTGGRITPSSMNSERPSAIPRPSLNYSRPSLSSTNTATPQKNNKNDTKRPGQPRARTYSRPLMSDAAQASKPTRSNEQSNPPTTRTTNALPTPASSRSNSPVLPSSPALEERDARSTKTSGNKRSGQTTPTYNRPLQLQDKYDSQERWDVDEDTYDASYSSIHVDVPRHVKQNGILHEPPPFSANSSFASEINERPSLEECPYEHWYRGDLSRNGGVGELRVGNRMEMLEIASYGHKLRNIRNDTLSRQRRRAESIGHRESAIFAEEPANLEPMVLDETPLTDMEADTELETDREQSFSLHEQTPLEQPKRSNDASNAMAPPSTPKHRQPAQVPRATPNAARATQRTASEPLHSKSLSSATSSTTTPSGSRYANGARMPNSHSQPLSTPAQKRGRAKSPAAAPASKKPRPSATQQRRSKSTAAAERLRPSQSSEYPEVPDGPGSMADAIPSWTQPKKAGNWDDVVLPVVARKMGLEDQYEEADGSPKAGRPQSEEVAPPQPGTFAFDASKRRQRYDPATGQEIPIEELDRIEKIEEEPSPTRTINNDYSNQSRMSKRISTANGNGPMAVGGLKQYASRYSPPPSPAPFIQYKTSSPTKPEPLQEMTIEEEKHGGCCGCTIM